MNDRMEAIEYAREVYAACATVGYDTPDVTRLKRLLDSWSELNADDRDAALAETLDLARRAQAGAVAWAGRSSSRL